MARLTEVMPETDMGRLMEIATAEWRCTVDGSDNVDGIGAKDGSCAMVSNGAIDWCWAS